jgi:hypothetical protein
MLNLVFLIISFCIQCTQQMICQHNDSHIVIKNNCPINAPVAYVFAHGIAENHQQASLFLPENSEAACARWIAHEPLIAFNFPDAKNSSHEYARKEVNLGQENDIAQLHQAYQKAITTFPDHMVVLTGISRGASTIINFIAQHQPTQVKALVLESPFDTLDSVIRHLLSRFHVSWVPFSHQIGYSICKKHFPKINIKGIFPLNCADRLPLSMPILLVHSKKDKVVPIKSSRNLYLKLKQIGHEHVYLAELASGVHGKLIGGADSDFYLYIVHAFYKRYNLPHEPDLATKGARLLTMCQPTIEEVQQLGARVGR